MKLEAPDQRIKLLFPAADGQSPQLVNGPDWYGDYDGDPKEQRPVMRTYTLRALRREQNQMDVEFVLHGERPGFPPGRPTPSRVTPFRRSRPTASSAATAAVTKWAPPAQLQQALLIADETAVPAAIGILEQLAQQANPPRVQAFFEVPVAGDCLDLARFPFAEVYWLPRDVGRQLAHGTLLVEEVRQRVDIPRRRGAQAQSPGGKQPER